MVKHNNVIPNNHFRKHWQRNVRVWLNQSQRKHRRLIARRAKAASLSPRPLEALRPAVRCQTIRYNHRPRLGRGFTLAEIKAAGLGVQFARSVGISVDHRRKNRNQESLELNKNRLLAYVNKLVLFPRNEKTPVTKAKSGILNDTPKVNFLIISGQPKGRLSHHCQRIARFSQESQISIKVGIRKTQKDWRLQIH
jgi:ribosomal protein L13E